MNIHLGLQAGENVSGLGQPFIDVSATSSPLIWRYIKSVNEPIKIKKDLCDIGILNSCSNNSFKKGSTVINSIISKFSLIIGIEP